jgi:spore cortex formation protein SpoVR/YcgB (stage V sporulation)
MMRDIERIATKPTEEDRIWAPDIVGAGDPMPVLKDIWANFRDESFISQYLSPHLMREMRMFSIEDDPEKPELIVNAIHDERGYRRIRRTLARHYDLSHSDPIIEVAAVDLYGDRRLVLEHKVAEGRLLAAGTGRKVLQYIADLWGYDVELKEVSASTGQVLADHHARPIAAFGG